MKTEKNLYVLLADVSKEDGGNVLLSRVDCSLSLTIPSGKKSKVYAQS